MSRRGETPTPTPPSLDIDDFRYYNFYTIKGLAFINDQGDNIIVVVNDNGTTRVVAFDPDELGGNWQLYTKDIGPSRNVPAELVSKTNDNNFVIDVQVEGYAPFRFTFVDGIANPQIPETPR